MTEEEWAGATEDDGGRCMVASVQAGVQLYNDSFLVTLNIFLKSIFNFLLVFLTPKDLIFSYHSQVRIAIKVFEFSTEGQS